MDISLARIRVDVNEPVPLVILETYGYFEETHDAWELSRCGIFSLSIFVNSHLEQPVLESGYPVSYLTT